MLDKLKDLSCLLEKITFSPLGIFREVLEGGVGNRFILPEVCLMQDALTGLSCVYHVYVAIVSVNETETMVGTHL